MLPVNCLYDLRGQPRFVHGVDMDVVYTVFLQVPDLADGIIDTRLAHVFGVIAVGGDQVGELLGHAGAGQGDGGADLLC